MRCPGKGALMRSCCTLSCELKLSQIHRQVVGEPAVTHDAEPVIVGVEADDAVIPDPELLPASRDVTSFRVGYIGLRKTTRVS